MTQHAGYNSQVSITGTAVAITGEACSVVSGDTYQITDATRQILDPLVSPLVYENGVISLIDYTIDSLRGLIYFASTPTAPVTIDCTYLPSIVVGLAKAWTQESTRNLLDVTSLNLGGTPAKDYVNGIKEIKVTFENFETMEYIYGTTRLRDVIQDLPSAGYVVVELVVGTEWNFRAFMVPSSYNTTATVEETIMAASEWMLKSPGTGPGFSYA